MSTRKPGTKTNAVTKLTCIKSKCQNQKAAMNLLSRNLKQNAATFVETSLHLTWGLAFGGAFEKRPPGTEAQLKIES